MALLEVADLSVALTGANGPLQVLRRVGFTLERGRVLGVVGESGSGKTMTALALLGLLPDGAHATGSLRLDGRELRALAEPELCRLRGDRIAMIFQEPMTALNPLQPIGRQVAEPLRLHRAMDAGSAMTEAVRLLGRVHLPDPAHLAAAFPHQLSGGQRQRAMIAMALACGPDLLVADEPTTALDVTIQAQILDLMRGLRRDTGTAIILITHDLGVVAEMADDVAVMYAGQIVERAPVRDLFARPEHPYTVGLLGSIPRLDEKRERLPSIEGRVPDMTRRPVGCRFAARCPFVEPACRDAEPALVEVAPGHLTRCRRAPLADVLR